MDTCFVMQPFDGGTFDKRYEDVFSPASGKEVVLVCSDERTTKFPFDVQHRTIIKYSTSSTSDFKKLELDITTKIIAYFEKAETLSNISELTKLTSFEGLDSHEVVTLAAIAQNLDAPDGNTSTFVIKRDMEASGYTKLRLLLL